MLKSYVLTPQDDPAVISAELGVHRERYDKYGNLKDEL